MERWPASWHGPGSRPCLHPLCRRLRGCLHRKGKGLAKAYRCAREVDGGRGGGWMFRLQQGKRSNWRSISELVPCSMGWHLPAPASLVSWQVSVFRGEASWSRGARMPKSNSRSASRSSFCSAGPCKLPDKLKCRWRCYNELGRPARGGLLPP